MAWFPGQEMGDALVDVLLGDVEPQGRLPVTFPRQLEDTPAFEHHPGRNGVANYLEGRLIGYRWYDTVGREPLFPFGFGLGYADVSITAARAARSASPSRSICPTPAHRRGCAASCRSTPTAMRTTAPATTLNSASPGSPSSTCRPRVRPPRDRRSTRRTYQAWDVGTHAWIEVPGVYELRVGTSSRDVAERLVVKMR